MTNYFQILQIKIISAQDLTSVSRSMSTYALAWIDPGRKMRTRVDSEGDNCPQWNDKFPFRVSPEFLQSETATVVFEIYSVSWLRDTIVGSVRVPVASIIPANTAKRHARRAVALQIRRPSGRPRGILNITVSILDGAMQSMPLSGLGGLEEKTQTRPDPDQRSDADSMMRRVKSERPWPEEAARPPSSCNGPGSEAQPGGSMCNSDVGPSASVVAAAMAKGLYAPLPPKKGAASSNKSSQIQNPKSKHRGKGGGSMVDDGESSILQWADEESEEGVMLKIERWKKELNQQAAGHAGHEGRSRRHRRGHRRSKSDGVRLFRCFGMGLEFTIVCGSNQDDDDNKNGKKKVYHRRVHHASSDAESSSTQSQSYITL